MTYRPPLTITRFGQERTKMFMTGWIFPRLWRRCAKGAVRPVAIGREQSWPLLASLLAAAATAGPTLQKSTSIASTLSAKCSRKDKELLRCCCCCCCFPFSLSLVNSPRWCTSTQVPRPPSRIRTRLLQFVARPHNITFPKFCPKSGYSKILHSHDLL